MTLLWKGTSAPGRPLLKGQGGNAPIISPLSGVPVSKVASDVFTAC